MTETAATEKLLLQKDGPIGWITFNQPEKRNAVSQEMWQLILFRGIQGLGAGALLSIDDRGLADVATLTPVEPNAT